LKVIQNLRLKDIGDYKKKFIAKFAVQFDLELSVEYSSASVEMALAVYIFLVILVPRYSDGGVIDSILIDEMHDDGKIDLTSLGVMLFSEPDETVGKIVNDWNPSSGQNPEELGSYVEGDMLIPGVEGRNGLVKTSSRWPNGVVPYVISSSISSTDRATILRAMEIYKRDTCIRFVPRSSEADYISIESSNTGCWSSVGRVGKRQIVNLQSPGCITRIGTPLHELMHALGFVHEQNRYDRDNFVRILFSNIKQGESFEG
jgi:hypothetical protein